MTSKHVCILGAGIIGLATAWQLRREGWRVSVIDRGVPGHGASGANGAQLSYSYVQPLADPSIWTQLPKLLLSRTSPLKLRPRLDPAQWRWGLEFLSACNAATSRETTLQLLALAAESRAAFDVMRHELTPSCDFSGTGKLVLYSGVDSLEAAARQLELQRRLGGSLQRLVGPQECVAIEPALASYASRLAGAIYTPSECAADCLKLCGELEAALVSRGVAFHKGVEVHDILRSGGRVAAVSTSVGLVEADTYVLALGSASPRLARRVGVRLPVYPLKGYSITLEVNGAAGAAPRVSVTDSARKVVFARIGSRLRVAGMAELVGHGTGIPAARIRTLEAATRALFPRAGRFDELRPWAGMRPATPTGRPVVGRHPAGPANLLFNTGHGALGFTLAFGSAQRVAKALGAVSGA